jgi:hypothetical protein
LRLLIFGVAGEVGDVERERGPVADHGGERGEEEVKEAGVGGELAGRGEDRAEAAGAVQHVSQEGEAHDGHEGRGEALQEADGFDAAPDDGHVEEPEAEETEPSYGW